MTRIVRLRERLPSLWRPEEGDSGLVSGLLDAVAMIGVGIALFFTFANPFVGQLQAALGG